MNRITTILAATLATVGLIATAGTAHAAEDSRSRSRTTVVAANID